MDTDTKRISSGAIIFAAVSLFAALILAVYFLYAGQFTEQDFDDDLDRPPQIVEANIAPTATLRPTPTQVVVIQITQPPTVVPPTATSDAQVPTQAPPQPTATLPDETINLPMIALLDNGASGAPTGCGDSVVYVQRIISGEPHTEARIAAALADLFSLHSQIYEATGYYNALYQSELAVNSVTLTNGVALVELTGNILMTDDCDRSRIEAQIEQTILQFSDVSDTQVLLNDVPLEVALAAQ